MEHDIYSPLILDSATSDEEKFVQQIEGRLNNLDRKGLVHSRSLLNGTLNRINFLLQEGPGNGLPTPSSSRVLSGTSKGKRDNANKRQLGWSCLVTCGQESLRVGAPWPPRCRNILSWPRNELAIGAFTCSS